MDLCLTKKVFCYHNVYREKENDEHLQGNTGNRNTFTSVRLLSIVKKQNAIVLGTRTCAGDDNITVIFCARPYCRLVATVAVAAAEADVAESGLVSIVTPPPIVGGGGGGLEDPPPV